MNDFLKKSIDEFKESPTYVFVSDKWSGLDSKIKQVIVYAIFGILMLFVLYLPYSFWGAYVESKTQFQGQMRSLALLQSYHKANLKIKEASSTLRANFNIIGAKTLKNTVDNLVSTRANLTLDAVKNFTDAVEDHGIIDEIKGSFLLDSINYRHLTSFLSAAEEPRNGIIIDNISISQNNTLDGFLNAQINFRAYSLKDFQ